MNISETVQNRLRDLEAEEARAQARMIQLRNKLAGRKNEFPDDLAELRRLNAEGIERSREISFCKRAMSGGTITIQPKTGGAAVKPAKKGWF